MTIKVPLNIGVRGRYKVFVRDAFGKQKAETSFGGNLITNIGLDYFFTPTRNPYQLCVVSPDNTPPAMGDAVMGDALGYANTYTSTIVTDSNIDPLSGPIYRTVAHTRTFPPGTFGGAPVNIAKAGIVAAAVISPNLSTLRGYPLLSAGLLVDNLGNPTTVSVLPTDYLDLVWEYTEFYTYDLSDTFVLDDNGTPVNIDITVRPAACFDAGSNGGWGNLASSYANVNPSFNTRNTVFMGSGSVGTQIGYLSSGLPAINAFATPTSPTSVADRRPNSITPSTYVSGSFNLTTACSWGPGRGNGVPFNNILRLSLGAGDSGSFSILLNPTITKTALQQLELVFQVSMANV